VLPLWRLGWKLRVLPPLAPPLPSIHCSQSNEAASWASNNANENCHSTIGSSPRWFGFSGQQWQSKRHATSRVAPPLSTSRKLQINGARFLLYVAHISCAREVTPLNFISVAHTSVPKFSYLCGHPQHIHIILKKNKKIKKSGKMK
jgi:hypothetical protein